MADLPRGAFSSQERIPRGYRRYSMQQYTPEQMELFGEQFSHLGPDSFLGRLAGGDESMFAEMEQPALRQFGELQGNIASRFSGMGMGGRKSSGFQNTMNTAAQDFASQLQAQRLGLRSQAIKDLMTMSNQLLNQRPFEAGLREKHGKGGGMGEFVSSLFGGGPGMATGDTQGAMQGMSNIARMMMQLGG